MGGGDEEDAREGLTEEGLKRCLTESQDEQQLGSEGE